MDRRNFLKGTMAVPAVALLPIYRHKNIKPTVRFVGSTTNEAAKLWLDEVNEQYDKDAMHLDGDRDG